MKNSSSTLLATLRLPWFSLRALALGAGAFAVATQAFNYRKLAIAAWLMLLLVNVAMRFLPAIQRTKRLRCALEVAALLIFVSLMAAANNGVRSGFLTLFLLPLTVAAISLT